jgi:hypothetical protein
MAHITSPFGGAATAADPFLYSHNFGEFLLIPAILYKFLTHFLLNFANTKRPLIQPGLLVVHEIFKFLMNGLTNGDPCRGLHL